MMNKFINFTNRILITTRYYKINGINTHLTSEEKLVLLSLAKASEGIYVEIGSFLGASSCFISEGIRQSGKDSQLYCIDTWENDAMSEGNRDTYAEFLRNTIKYKKFIRPLRGWSYEVAKNFDQPIDLIFIDGDHSYEGVKEDVDLWLPKLNSGAIVVMHDIGWAEGVQRIVKEKITPVAISEDRLPNMYCARIR